MRDVVDELGVYFYSRFRKIDTIRLDTELFNKFQGEMNSMLSMWPNEPRFADHKIQYQSPGGQVIIEKTSSWKSYMVVIGLNKATSAVFPEMIVLAPISKLMRGEEE